MAEFIFLKGGHGKVTVLNTLIQAICAANPGDLQPPLASFIGFEPTLSDSSTLGYLFLSSFFDLIDPLSVRNCNGGIIE